MTDADGSHQLRLGFETTVIYWRGPSPFFYAPVPPEPAAAIRRVSRGVSYGWGCIPVTASVGGVDFRTSLFPKDGTYLVPLKAAVRRRTSITAGDVVRMGMTIDLDAR